MGEAERIVSSRNMLSSWLIRFLNQYISLEIRTALSRREVYSQ
jgi:hypothetical protein